MSPKDLTPKDHAERVALFRSEVVGALTRRVPGAPVPNVLVSPPSAPLLSRWVCGPTFLINGMRSSSGKVVRRYAVPAAPMLSRRTITAYYRASES